MKKVLIDSNKNLSKDLNTNIIRNGDIESYLRFINERKRVSKQNDRIEELEKQVAQLSEFINKVYKRD